jgi:glycosyltransferase involved in cell wall biosynthesis
MNKRHPVLSHQPQVVEELSIHFKEITVLTLDNLNRVYSINNNIRIYSPTFGCNNRLLRFIKFYIVFIQILIKHRPQLVFSHMAIVPSLSVIPITKLLCIPNVLWYAHAKRTLWTYLAKNFCTKVISSTRGSFPHLSPNVHFIGQGIPTNVFLQNRTIRAPIKSCVYVGRLDVSKNIHLLIETVFNVRKLGFLITLSLYGSPLRGESLVYIQQLQDKWLTHNSTWLKFNDSIPRSDIPRILKEHDVFIHAFQGSLDKTLVEASLSGIGIVTTNKEFQQSFRYPEEQLDLSLQDLLIYYLSMSEQQRMTVMLKNQKIAAEEHSSTNWMWRLVTELRSS